MVVGFWMTPFLKKLFEDYIAENGGNPSALVAALNR
jgi:phospholipid transport system substrate-binding protein